MVILYEFLTVCGSPWVDGHLYFWAFAWENGFVWLGGGDIWFMIFHIYGLVFTSISLTNTLIIRFLLDFRMVSCFGKQV